MTEQLGVLAPNRKMPILPATIHAVPNVTIEKLANALYYIGRSAVRQTKDPNQMRATLALIATAAKGALE